MTRTMKSFTIGYSPIFAAMAFMLLVMQVLSALAHPPLVEMPVSASQPTEAFMPTELELTTGLNVRMEQLLAEARMSQLAAEANVTSKPTEVPGPVFMFQHNATPDRLIIESLDIELEIANFGSDKNTHKGVANWNPSFGTFWADESMLIYGFDHGWKNEADNAFAFLSDLKPETVLYVKDSDGVFHGFVYEGMFTVPRESIFDTSTSLSHKLFLMGSAGADIYDDEGRIIDSTHRGMFMFREMSLVEYAMGAAR